MPDEITQITGKLKGMENDGIIIVTDEEKNCFSFEKNITEHLLGKMLKTVTVEISNNIVTRLLDDDIKPTSLSM